ncbi:unnamed protein product [Hermetia illucens]|uniref:Uncharacterized protein n=1 Tax=Hermetia illucens TaxID=343691 RepID=A0A7R8UNW1_HERIL|nr:uncharacterized protein LOC119652433 isoform X2 [Hermetia illucens]XP_037912492.1 uncharacterized protein LOC119652433 isoform X2 [Hermetia illucens]XP_037912493.1 uncharacterized protein LOC119652433 isoform X2 [Hermetia illucens]XP_037912495.1 uncharacterized protein LOC119652433 isoform X2 [Hermetia illucens]XP_037912496.1 uncharacterized protein LOC119652433 isoform X2 [Hermetia illucens]XP_037912497.1 uncharacterized protein LOC119652433 isoform X2 [Hermetia illucens]XP_037912498.1 un
MFIKTRKGLKRLLLIMKCSVLFCMVVIMMTAILSITGAQNLFQAFDGNCIYACNISFVPRNENATAILNSTLSRTQTSSSKDNASVITSTTEAVTESSTTRETTLRPRKIHHIFRSLESEYPEEDEPDTEEETATARALDISRDQVRNEADYNFLSTMKVDIVKTLWASVSFCDYVLYNQILSAIAAMVCTTMLILYNSSGKSQLDWGIPRPWRIVFPAVIAFGVMSIVSLIHLLVMNSAYRDFCGGLANNLETKTLKCNKLINALRPAINDTWITPGDNYTIHTVTIRITLVAWFAAFLIMLARMIFIIDFRLVRVNLPACAQRRRSTTVESISSESVEVVQKTGKLEAAASKSLEPARAEQSLSSREDVDEFQSAYSHFEPTSTQPTSLEPLLPNQTPRNSHDFDV